MILNFIPAIEVPVWLAIFADVGVSLIAITNSMIMMRRFRKARKQSDNKEQTDEKE